MTSKEGKAFLENCLREHQSDTDIDDCICYKTGNKIEAAAYQGDTIQTDVDWSTQRETARFVVKCFVHMGLYVAWPREVGQGAGKYIFYTKDLVAMERDKDCDFREFVIDNSEKAYVFRGEQGIEQFVKDYLVPTL